MPASPMCERCQGRRETSRWSSPRGERRPRPKAEERARPDADVNLPRPSTDPLPFELFAYDEDFSASSSAGPRFPSDLKRVLRFSSPSGAEPFVTTEGTGVQAAAMT